MQAGSLRYNFENRANGNQSIRPFFFLRSIKMFCWVGKKRIDFSMNLQINSP